MLLYGTPPCADAHHSYSFQKCSGVHTDVFSVSLVEGVSVKKKISQWGLYCLFSKSAVLVCC